LPRIGAAPWAIIMAPSAIIMHPPSPPPDALRSDVLAHAAAVKPRQARIAVLKSVARMENSIIRRQQYKPAARPL
jgi:hypothetical protein